MEDALYYKNLGNDFYDAGNLQEAIKAYEKSIEIDPTFAIPEYNLGLAYYSQKQYQNAIKHYQNAIEKDPNDAAPENGLGNVFNDLKQYQKAIKHYQFAIEKDPNYAAPENGLGNVFNDLKQYQKAIKHYQFAIEKDPNHAAPEYGLGIVFNDLKQYQNAIKHYQFAIEKDPNYAAPENGLGTVYKNLKQYQNAIKHYQSAIEKDPNYAAPENGLGNVFNDLKQYQKAIKHYQFAIEKDPNHAAPEYGLGIVFNDLKQYQNAIKHYQFAIEKDPNYAAPENGLGIVFNDLKQYQNAIKHYQSAIEKDPNHAAPEYGLGTVYHDLKQYQNAIKHYQFAIEKDQNFAAPENGLGIVYHDLKQYQNAINHCQFAIEKDPNYAYPENGLGTVYKNLKQYQNAIKHYQFAIEKDPNYAAPENGLGNVYYDLKQYQNAINYYQFAIEKDPNFALPLLNLGFLYKETNDFILAELYFSKYLSLEKEEIKGFSSIIPFYRDIASAPYILKFVTQKLSFANDWLTFKGLFEKVERECKVIDNYLLYLQFRGEDEQQTLAYKHLLSLVNFYMGNYPEAFRLYNDEIDLPPPQQINLMGSYYFLVSAIKSLVPTNEYDDILENALADAHSYYTKYNNEHDELSELYYAGQICYYAWENSKDISQLELADKYFRKADSLVYLPAAYMRVLTLKHLNQQEEKNKQIARVKQYEQHWGKGKGFAEGFETQLIDTETSDFLTQFKHYAHFKEILEAINEVNGSTTFRLPEFYETFTLGNEQEIEAFIYQKQIEKLKNELLEEFDIKIRSEQSEEKIDKLRKEFLGLDLISRLSFRSLTDDAKENPKELEVGLAVFVNHFVRMSNNAQQVYKNHQIYEKMIQYFVIKNELDILPAWTLLYYSYYTEEKIKTNFLQNLFTNDSILEGETDVLKEVLGNVGKELVSFFIMIGSIQVPYITFFASLTVRIFIEQQKKFVEIKKQNLPAEADYQAFKNAFDKNVVENILLYKNQGVYDENLLSEVQNWANVR